jgi:catechol 2,3-dioxygenase-like lactoylglutathione lyase family enzyme
MRIILSSVFVDDQDKALAFYTGVLGFVTKQNFPVGKFKWLTVVSPPDPDGVELLLEPNAEYPAMKALKESLVNDGIPYTAFMVDDVQAEYERLKGLGVDFAMEPTDMGITSVAMLDDTCGNYIQIYQVNEGADPDHM